MTECVLKQRVSWNKGQINLNSAGRIHLNCDIHQIIKCFSKEKTIQDYYKIRRHILNNSKYRSYPLIVIS